MENYQSGEELFFRYSYGCAEERFLRNLISASDYTTLTQIAQGIKKPERSELRSLLKRCFPRAVLNFENSRKGEKSDWSREEVAKYWHFHLGSSNFCAVRLFAVKSVNDENVDVGLPNTVVKNLYSIDLTVGDRIWVHRGIAVETSGQSATLG